MIKLSILFIGLISLIYGSIFLFYPDLFVILSEAERVNIAWLRNIGASIIGLLFFGCLSIYFKTRESLSLLKIITVTSILQTTSLILSRFFNEFSAKNLIIIDLTIFLAIFISFYLAWLVAFKSYKFK